MNTMSNYADYMHYGAKVYLECMSYDPWMPGPNDPTLEAWGRMLLEKGLDLEEDVLPCIEKIYTQRTAGFRILPADILNAARELRADRRSRRSMAELEAEQDARDRELARNAPVRPLRAVETN